MIKNIPTDSIFLRTNLNRDIKAKRNSEHKYILYQHSTASSGGGGGSQRFIRGTKSINFRKNSYETSTLSLPSMNNFFPACVWKICHRLLSRRHKKIGAWSEAGRQDAVKINDMSRRNAQRASCAGVVLTSNPHCDATMPNGIPTTEIDLTTSIDWSQSGCLPAGGYCRYYWYEYESHDSLPDKILHGLGLEH